MQKNEMCALSSVSLTEYSRIQTVDNLANELYLEHNADESANSNTTLIAWT